MDIPPLELPFVVGREAAMPALPGGWPDMAAGNLRSEGSNLNRKEWLESIFRHHEVVYDKRELNNVGGDAFRRILHAFCRLRNCGCHRIDLLLLFLLLRIIQSNQRLTALGWH